MNFYNLLMALGIGACCFPTEQIQIFDELPVEIVILVLSYLDGKSLSIMSQMNKRLFQICQSNKGLRTKVQQHLRKEKKDLLRKMLNPVKVRVLRNEAANSARAFQSRNARNVVVATRVFDSSQVIPVTECKGKGVSSKRKSDCQEKKSRLSKRMRI